MKSIVPIILIILSISIWYFYIDPTYEDLKLLKVEQSEYQDVLDEVSQIQKTRKDLINKYNKFTREDLDRIKVLLPERANNIRLITDLDSLAAQQGISISNISISENNSSGSRGVVESSDKKYNTVDLSISFKATYTEFRSFLNELEQSLRIIDVMELTFSSSAGEDFSNEYQFDISLRSYWLK